MTSNVVIPQLLSQGLPGSRGGLFTRSGSVADPLMTERLPAIVNAKNRWCNSL